MPAKPFPLYLTPLERYFLADDRPSHPMTFYSVYEFLGVVDRPAFEAAIVEALDRHPLLSAVVRPAKRGMLCWVAAEPSEPVVHWGDLSEPITPEGGERIDVTKRIGVRIWVRQGLDRATAVFQFHHSCTDGIGALRFASDLFAAYGLRVPNDAESPRFDDLETERLRDRVNLQVEHWRTNKYGSLAARAFKVLGKLMRKRPGPLSSPGRDKRPAASFPGIQSMTLPRDEYEAIRAAALSSGAVLNDLLIAALFRTLHEWTQASGDRSARRPLRIMMPVDLRDGESLCLPAACLASYSFLERDQNACRDPAQLLQGVATETADIKNRHSGVEFSDSVAAALTTHLLGLVVAAPICLASAVFSNIGDPTRRFSARLPRSDGRLVVGNLLVDDIKGVPPLRPHTRATFFSCTYRRRLTISVRCDATYFSDEDAERLLEIYVRHLRSYAVKPPVAGATEDPGTAQPVDVSGRPNA
jgi:hypothetical protein